MKPIRLYPVAKDYLWGGVRLKEQWGKDFPLEKVAETWELSLHKDGECTTADGVPLSEAVSKEAFGKHCEDFPFFPMLIKFIDACDNLSIQVHPSDAYALANENSFGKTEMWYILDATEEAGIYLGLKETTSREAFECAIREKRLCDILNFYPVKAGECYFIPSGTVHAIAKGCLIAEIQQNSNLTYRVYDYGRVDKNGKGRELHIEKAIAVSNLSAFENNSLHIKSNLGEILGVSKYFTVTKLVVDGEITLPVDEKTFRHLLCVGGEGSLDGEAVQRGESILLPAGEYEVKLCGQMEILMSEVRKYYVGIDLGGTFIKGGIVDDLGNILIEDKVPTESEGGASVVARNIANLANSLLARLNLTASDVVGIGMGVPGMIDTKRGIVTYSNNLAWENFEIAKTVEDLTSLPVRIANDANVAALGEYKFGSGKNTNSIVLVTLGTGVGGGAIIDGRMLLGNEGAGAEFGHSVLVAGGEPCTCGRRGCFEAYASATALIRDTKKAMESHPDSLMWKFAPTLDEVNGATSFSAMKQGDAVAKAVVDNYITMLGEGLCNIASVFRPDMILLGGGVSAEGDGLIVPLQEFVNNNIFGGKMGPRVKIACASLGNKAGLVGGAALLM